MHMYDVCRAVKTVHHIYIKWLLTVSAQHSTPLRSAPLIQLVIIRVDYYHNTTQVYCHHCLVPSCTSCHQ